MDNNLKKFIHPKYFKVRTWEQELKRIGFIQQIAGIKPPIVPRYIILFWASLIISLILVFFLNKTAIPQEAVYMSGIFIFAGLLWITEALPLFATSLLIIALEIILLANPGNWAHLGFAAGASPSYKTFLEPLANPIIVLFFGGFLLAQATIKEGIDKVLASVILKLFGSKPRMIMLGMMLITAIFSMWISNTATAAMMIALAVPIVNQIPEKDPFRKGIILSIPFAANIGGIGTPIASPPNAVAVSFLRNVGYDVRFVDWLIIALPLMIIMLIIAWLTLFKLFKPAQKELELKLTYEKIDKRGWYVIFIFFVTVTLWLTERFHGLPTAVVAMLPSVAFTATGLLKREDVNALEWHILILIMGGLALGIGMQSTGLDKILVNAIPLDEKYFLVVIAMATILFSTFMSNTAASNLLIPIGVTFALTSMANEPNSAIQVGISIALCASMAMALPISTPPNTIAYAKGELENKDFVVPGLIISFFAIILILSFGGLLVKMLF